MPRTLTCLLALGLSLPASAVPLEFTHQGRLMDSSGVPLDSTHNVDLDLFPTAAGGSAVWSDSFVPEFNNGYYDIRLGQGTPLDAAAFDGGALYMQLTVDGTTISERVPLLSVPYAFKALSADDVTPGAVLDIGELRINGTTVIDGTGSLSSDEDTLRDMGCTADQIPLSNGISWVCADLQQAHTHAASDLDSGVLDIARLPIGSGPAEVAVGDHIHGYAFSDLGGSADIAQLPVGTSATTVAAGSHGHTAADIGALDSGGGTLTGPLAGTDASFSGGVQLGDTSVCGSGDEGTMRWNSGALEVCDGTDWLQIGIDGSGTGVDPNNATRNCWQLKTDYPASADGVYWMDIDGLGGRAPFQVYCDMTSHGGGWTLVLAAGSQQDITPPSTRAEFTPTPSAPSQPPNSTLYKFSDADINAIRTQTGTQIGYWVTTPGSGTGLLGAENFHRADCVFQMSQTSDEVKATSCHQSTINYHATAPTWQNGGHWHDNSSAYRWAFGYANEGDHGTGLTCYQDGTGLGPHTPSHAPFHRGWCGTDAWGQVWVR